MDINEVGLLIFSVFLMLYFFLSQKIYSSKIFFVLIVFIISFSVFIYFFLNRFYPESVTPTSVFLNLYHAVLLLLIKLTYKKLNSTLIKKNWVNSSFHNKDFTFVVDSYEGIGSDSWNEKLASKPSWFDYLLSYLLFFGPMFLVYITVDIIS